MWSLAYKITNAIAKVDGLLGERSESELYKEVLKNIQDGNVEDIKKYLKLANEPELIEAL